MLTWLKLWSTVTIFPFIPTAFCRYYSSTLAFASSCAMDEWHRPSAGYFTLCTSVRSEPYCTLLLHNYIIYAYVHNCLLGHAEAYYCIQKCGNQTFSVIFFCCSESHITYGYWAHTRSSLWLDPTRSVPCIGILQFTVWKVREDTVANLFVVLSYGLCTKPN